MKNLQITLTVMMIGLFTAGYAHSHSNGDAEVFRGSAERVISKDASELEKSIARDAVAMNAIEIAEMQCKERYLLCAYLGTTTIKNDVSVREGRRRRGREVYVIEVVASMIAIDDLNIKKMASIQRIQEMRLY